jgi:hypothetical protein
MAKQEPLRSEIEQMWRDLLERRRSKEHVTAWAEEHLASLDGVHIMEEIGLQQLAGLNRGLTVTGEFVGRDDPWMPLDQWLAQCAAYDTNPSGVVLISEDSNPWGGRDGHMHVFKGTFSASWQGVSELESPQGMTIDEALVWARRYSDKVEVWFRDTMYSAGTTDLDGMQHWTGDIDVSPVEERSPGDEWRDRLSGKPVVWNVALAPSIQGISDRPEFRDRFLEALQRDSEVVIAPDLDAAAFAQVARFHPAVVLRVVATDDDEATAIANKSAMSAVSSALREVGASGSIGWTMACKAQPVLSRFL